MRKKHLPMLFSCESSECSLACIAMIATFHGRAISVGALRERHPVSLLGLTLKDALSVARSIGLEGRVLRCEPADLVHVALPAMLHWDLEHMVVLDAVRGGRHVIHDPSRGVLELTTAELSEHFTGIAIELRPAADFRTARERRRISLRELVGDRRQLWPGLLQVLGLSAAIEALALSQPLLLRSIIDRSLPVGNASYIASAAAVLGVCALALGCASLLRDFAVLRTGTALSFSIMRRLFGHTMRLPLPFFEKRPLGHLMERYRVTEQLERFLTTSLPLALIDGVMALLALGLITWLSPSLGTAVLGVTAGYAGWRVLRWRAMQGAEEALIHAKGEESGFLTETLRTIFTTKANVLEPNRHQIWTTYYGDVVDAQRRFGTLDLQNRAARLALAGIAAALLIAIGGNAVVEGKLTLGALLAVLLLGAHFVTRGMQLVDRAYEFLLLRVRLERLEDIVLATPEPGGEQSAQTQQVQAPLCGAICVEGVAFRYGESDRQVLENVSFSMRPGEFVALVGDNGAGKTTLMKLLLGMYQPSEGRIRYGALSTEERSLPLLREQIGVVSQDDQLILGTVEQNISVFDVDVDMEQVVRCATLAGVHEEILRLPLGYRTRVGGLGSPFSEGQKQKIFLARALYRNPRVLLMDEGTANIAPAAEEQMLSNLQALGMTMLLIAHRSATVRRADRVLTLRNGRIEEPLQRSVAG